MQYQLKDGSNVRTELALYLWKGPFIKGRVQEILYQNENGNFYIVKTVDKIADWITWGDAVTWLKSNGYTATAEIIEKEKLDSE